VIYVRYILRERDYRTVIGFVAVVAAAFSAVWLRHGTGIMTESGGTPWSTYLVPTLIIGLVFVPAMRLLDVHGRPIHQPTPWLRISYAVGIALSFAIVASFFFRLDSYSRVTVAIFWPLGVLFVGVALFFYRSLHRRMLISTASGLRLLIVGAGTVGCHIGHSIAGQPGFYTLVGYLEHKDERDHTGQLEVLGDAGDLRTIIDEHDIDEVIIAAPSASRESILDVIGSCMQSHVRWKVVPSSYDLLVDRADVDVFDGIPVLGIRDTRLVGVDWFAKRMFDILFAGIVLLVLSPLLLVIALAIKLTSPGPVLFKQVRIGMNESEFTLYKFRSMYVDGGVSDHQSFTADWIHGQTGADETDVHKIVNDPRITRVGRFICGTSIDELPQFWNVLRGEMSVVGPRPPLPYEVAKYTEWHLRRLKVPPGITGLWQVSGRNALSFDEMIRLDIRYIETWSLRMDLSILAHTFPSMLSNPGS
jgi:exopolysaccharide biosynthesis polyprenyl glycosylphosphotransferase